MPSLPQSGVALVAQDANAFFSDMKQAARAVDAFSDQTDQTAKRVNAFSEIVIGSFRHAGEAVFDFGRDALRGVKSFISDSIDLSGDFQQTMDILAETSGATAEEMARVSQKADQLGADLTLPATSAVSAGEAMLELSKAGFTVQQAMDAAKGTLQLSAAAQIEEAEAAEIASNAINAFGLEASDAIFVSDLLAASASASSIEITDTAQSFKMASAIFANFQGPIVGSKEAMVDLTTAIGILGNAGIKGTSAGTYLSQALQQLTGPSDKAKGLMEDLAARIGVTGDIAFDSAGNMRPFQEIIGLTAQATAGMTDEQRSFYLTTIYGSDGMKALLPLMAAGAEGWDKMAAAVTRQGAAADLAAAQTQGYKGAVEGTKSQIETLQKTIGTALLPVLTSLHQNYLAPGIAGLNTFAQAVLGNVNAWSELSPPLQDATDVLRGLVDFFARGKLDNLYSGLIGLFGGPTAAVIVDFADTIRNLPQTLRTATQQISEILENPFAAIRGWGERLTADVMTQLPNWQAALEGYAAAASEWIKKAIPPALDNLADMRGQLFSWISDSLPGWLTEVGRFAEPAAQWVLDAIPDLLDNLGTFAKRMIDQTLTYLPQWGATLVEFGVKAISWVGDALPGLADNLGKFLNEMANWVVDSLPRWGEQLAEFGGKAVTWVLDALPGLGTNLGTMAGKILGWAIETAADVIPKLAVLGAQFVGWVATDVLPELPGALYKIGEGIFNFIAGLVKEVAPKLMEVGGRFVDWIKDVLPKIPPALNEIKISINKWIGETAAWAVSRVVIIGSELVAGIKKGIQDNWNSFKNWVIGLMEGLKDAVLEFFGIESPSYVMATEVGEPIVLGMLEGMKGALPTLMNFVDKMTDDIQRQFEDAARAITDTMISIKRGVAGGYRTQAENLRKLAEFSDTSDIAREIADTEDERYSILLKLNEEMAKGVDANQTVIDQYKEQIALLEQRKTALTQTEKDQKTIASGLETRLNDALIEAQKKFTDPRDVMAYYDLLSGQAFEFADLQQQYYDAVAKNDTARMVRLSDQMLLIDRAQALERDAFTQQAGQQNELLDLQQQIAGLNEFAKVLGDMPAVLLNFFKELVDLANFASGPTPEFGLYQGGSVSPPATAGQIMAAGTTNNYYGQVGNSYQMPVHTSQSPAVVQQGFWIMQAAVA